MLKETHIAIRFEDVSFWATVQEFPGVFATGDSLEELRESLEEGISLYLADPGAEPTRVHLDELRPELVETAVSAQLALA